MNMEEIAFNNACAVVCAEMQIYRDQLLFVGGEFGEQCRGMVMYLMSEVHGLPKDAIADVFDVPENKVGYHLAKVSDLDASRSLGDRINKMRQKLEFLAKGSVS